MQRRRTDRSGRSATLGSRLLGESDAPVIRREIVPLTAARLAANGCYRFAPPFLATIARGLDVSLSDLGVAIAVTELVGLASPVIARRIDTVARKTSMTVALAGVIAGALLAAASTHVVMFAAAIVVLAISKISFDVALGAWIVDHVPYHRRSRVVGLTETSWALGLLVGVTTMGLVASVTSWRWGFVAGAVGVAAALAVVRARLSPGLPRPRRRHGEDDDNDDGGDRDEQGVMPAIGTIDAAGRWMLVASFGLMGASQTMFVTFGAWLEDDFGFSAGALSAVTFGLGALELGASSLSAARTDRWGKERSVLLGASLMIPAGLALALLDGLLVPGLLLLGVFFVGFEFGIVSAIAVAGTLVPGAPARGLGALIAAGTLARSAVAVPATSLFERHGLGASATVGVGCAVITVVGAAMRLQLLGARGETTSPGVTA